MTRTRQVARWTALAGAFAIALEGAARLDDAVRWGTPPWSPHDPEVLSRVGVDGVPRNVPGARFEKWRIDSLGFRGPEIALEKLAGHRRIVVLGQSETFGLYESEGGEWPERLRRMLTTAGSEVEVVNASVVGTGRASRLEYLEHDLLPLHPDVVILIPNVYREASADAGLRGAPSRQPRPGRVGPELGRRLRPRVLPKLERRLKQVLPASLVAAIQCWKLERKIRQQEARLLRGERPLDRVPDGRIAGYEDHLETVVARARSRGATVVLATYPTLAREENRVRERAALLGVRAYHAEFSESGLVAVTAQYNEATRQVARRLGVALVDLERAVPADADHFVDQVHYTDAGAQRVAEAVLAQIAAAGMLARPGPDLAVQR